MKLNSGSWLAALNEEDLVFLKRFLLASGSLKELAKLYGISYPTVRLRLNRLIEKVNIVDDENIPTAFERELRLLYADGRIDRATLDQLMKAHEKELLNHENSES